jgi:hypothetical protein
MAPAVPVSVSRSVWEFTIAILVVAFALAVIGLTLKNT